MGLIKSNNIPSAVTSFSLKDVETHAKAILLRARQQADQLLAAAEEEGKTIRQNAYNEGFKGGQQDGLRKGTEDGKAAGQKAALAEQKAKLEQLTKTLLAAVAELDASRSRLESSAGTEVLKLAVTIARRVTHKAGLDAAVLSANVNEAMKLVVHSADVRIAIHPSQKQTLLEVLPQLKQAWPNVSHLELIEDPQLTPGGCRIHTAQGQIDADLNHQIDRIAADLLPTTTAAELA
jgi:flagellar assembly protein FliH